MRFPESKFRSKMCKLQIFKEFPESKHHISPNAVNCTMHVHNKTDVVARIDTDNKFINHKKTHFLVLLN